MIVKQDVNFKYPLYVLTWLNGALKKEKEKYKKCPLTKDLIPDYEAVQAWGFVVVVVGYVLLEVSFKALLFVRNEKVPKKHSLSTLYSLLSEDDRSVLRESYSDYRATIGGVVGAFPFESLDEFLLNLDGDENKKKMIILVLLTGDIF